MRSLLDHMTTVVIALDGSLRFHYLNASAENLLKQSSRRACGLPASQVISQPELHRDLTRALVQKQRFTRREAPLTINGKTILADYSITPLELTDTPLLLEVHPLDRLHQITREESQNNTQEVSRILAKSLAHEIKNPLGGIRGAAQLLARQLTTPSLTDYTEVIIQEADRLRDLVDRMLGPLTPPKIVPVNIHEILERVIQLVSAETRGELAIIRDYDPSIPDIPADRELLIQAFLNLSNNAIQAISQAMALTDGRLQIRTRITRQFTLHSQCRKLVCHIRIMDNGSGIASHLKDSIFLPMISGRPEGTGLGLAVTQSIISQHQGLIECDSRPGETGFDVYLPLAEAAANHPLSHSLPKTRSAP